jgi:hypothetical protein
MAGILPRIRAALARLGSRLEPTGRDDLALLFLVTPD